MLVQQVFAWRLTADLVHSRGGTKRLSELMFEETRGILVVFLKNVLKDACVYCEFRRAKTLMASDVVLVCVPHSFEHTHSHAKL